MARDRLAFFFPCGGGVPDQSEVGGRVNGLGSESSACQVGVI